MYVNYCIPVEFTVFQNANYFIHRKNISRYQVAVVTLFWAQKRKLHAKYSSKVLSSKLDRFLSTVDVLWEKIAALVQFS